MTCFLSISYALPLCASQIISNNETNEKKLLDIYRLVSSTKPGISIIWSSCRLINPASWGSTRHLTMPSNHSDEIVSSCFRVTYCVIAGYWVGPDIDDDGWGFVEAFVNRTL